MGSAVVLILAQITNLQVVTAQSTDDEVQLQWQLSYIPSNTGGIRGGAPPSISGFHLYYLPTAMGTLSPSTLLTSPYVEYTLSGTIVPGAFSSLVPGLLS